MTPTITAEEALRQIVAVLDDNYYGKNLPVRDIRPILEAAGVLEPESDPEQEQ